MNQSFSKASKFTYQMMRNVFRLFEANILLKAICADFWGR
jgi:hypothetical protein